MSIYVAPARKAMLGPGAAAMQTQPYLTNHYGPLAKQKLMYQAAKLSDSVLWIRAVERVISGEFAGIDWHLEDEQDTEIDDQYPDQRYQDVWTLFERPQATITTGRQMTRRELWDLTSRHIGVCGNAFWYLDQLEPVGRTPGAILYIAPWRMSAAADRQGNLTGWVLDYDEHSGTGTPLEMDAVLQFTLQPPNEGHFGVGLVESAMSVINLDNLSVSHAALVLTSGGRLSGIISPKTESIPDDKFQQLVRDFRTITEMPDAARRTNILQSPVQFDRTAATPLELSLIDLMDKSKDQLLALWGVPLSQLNGTGAGGMNSGETKKYDQASLWQHAIHPRLTAFSETIQFQLLDRWKAFGMMVELEIDEPEFDDDGPRFELLQRSAGLPMRNMERRALVGLDPFGDPVLDNAIWLPINLVQVGVAPDENGNPLGAASIGGETLTVEAIPPPVPQLSAPTSKARLSPLQSSLAKLRASVEKAQTKPLREALRTFLANQRREIAARLRANAEHVARRPKDTAVWFPEARFNRELHGVLARPLTAMAQNVNDHISQALPKSPGKAGPVDAVDRALNRGAARVTGINQTTKDRIAAAVSSGIDQGLSVTELADLIEGIGVSDTITVDALFDEYRAELIARTELMDAYNGAALSSYSDGGVTEVEATDGDGDEECAARDGQVFSIEEADGIEDHPNGTLDWIPVVSEEPVKAVVVRQPNAEPVINVSIDSGPFAKAIDDLRTVLSQPRVRQVVRDQHGRAMHVTETIAAPEE